MHHVKYSSELPRRFRILCCDALDDLSHSVITPALYDAPLRPRIKAASFLFLNENGHDPRCVRSRYNVSRTIRVRNRFPRTSLTIYPR